MEYKWQYHIKGEDKKGNTIVKDDIVVNKKRDGSAFTMDLLKDFIKENEGTNRILEVQVLHLRDVG